MKKSDKTWSTGGGNGNPLQYSCQENPMNSTKGQKDTTLEDEPLGLEGVLGKSRGQLLTAPERMKWLGQSGNDAQLWMCLVVKGRWTMKKAERQRTDAFELRCYRRLLRVPWTARRSNQSILKEINPEYSLEGLMLKAPILWPLMQIVDSSEKTLMLGKTEGRRRRGWHRMR